MFKTLLRFEFSNDVELTINNKRKEYKITTQVIEGVYGKGGSISGENDNTYEILNLLLKKSKYFDILTSAVIYILLWF